MPIRFRQSLRWRINWSQERHRHRHKEFLEGGLILEPGVLK